MFSFSLKSGVKIFLVGLLFPIQTISFAQEEKGAEGPSESDMASDELKSQPLAGDEAASPDNTVVPEHPSVPERSHAALMPMSQISMPPLLEQASPKPPLAWRAKAQKIAMEKYRSTEAEITTGPLCRCVDGSYLDTMQAVITACNKNNFKVSNAYKTAGEILANDINDPNSRIVFAVWEKPAGKTWVKAGVEKGNASLLSKTLVTILDTISSDPAPKGKL